MSRARFERNRFMLFICAIAFPVMAAAATATAAIVTSPVASTITQMVTDTLFNIVLPLLGTLLTIFAGYASVAIGKFFTTKQADLLRQTVLEALQRGLMGAAIENPTAPPQDIIEQAVKHVKDGLPQTLKKLGAQDGPLATMAGALFTQMLRNGTLFLKPKP